MRRIDNGFLRMGVGVPVFYFGAMLSGAALYPGYSHARQMVSELGMADAPGRILFNAGILLAGVCGVAAGWGFFRVLRGRKHPVLGALTGLFVAIFGVAFVLGAAFPLPDPRHAAFGMGLAVHLAPLFLLAALWRDAELRGLKAYVAASAVLSFVLLAAMFGAGGVVNDGNFGLIQRLYALAAFPWIGVAGYRLASRGRTAADVPSASALQPAG